MTSCLRLSRRSTVSVDAPRLPRDPVRPGPAGGIEPPGGVATPAAGAVVPDGGGTGGGTVTGAVTPGAPGGVPGVPVDVPGGVTGGVPGADFGLSDAVDPVVPVGDFDAAAGSEGGATGSAGGAGAGAGAGSVEGVDVCSVVVRIDRTTQVLATITTISTAA